MCVSRRPSPSGRPVLGGVRHRPDGWRRTSTTRSNSSAPSSRWVTMMIVARACACPPPCRTRRGTTSDQVLDDGAGRRRVEVRDGLVEEHDRAAADRARAMPRPGALAARDAAAGGAERVSSPSGRLAASGARPAARRAARWRRRRRRAREREVAAQRRARRRGSRRRRRRCGRGSARAAREHVGAVEAVGAARRVEVAGEHGRAGSTCRCRWARDRDADSGGQVEVGRGEVGARRPSTRR